MEASNKKTVICMYPVTNSKKKTYNTRDSPVVTDPSTSLALTCLSMGERTGSRVFKWIWSYVLDCLRDPAYLVVPLRLLQLRYS